MTDTIPGVFGGVDCHADTHTAAALDPLGQLIGTAVFPASTDGYGALLDWLSSFGPIVAVGVESTGSYGAGLARHLADHHVHVIEVNQPHAHTRARKGKSDPIDAEAAARKVLSGQAAGTAKDTSGIVEAIRELSVTRHGAVKARAAALCQLGDLIVTAPAALREHLAGRKTNEGKATMCARLRPGTKESDPTTWAAKVALRSVARRIQALTAEIADLDTELQELVAAAAPTTMAQLGCGTQHTAALLVAAGENIDRFTSEASFAHLCATAPIPASSGRTTRHRLNYAGNRDANRALHMIVIIRLRYCNETKAYMQRRTAQGLTKRR